MLAAAAVAFAAFDWASELAGSSTFPGGPLDEIAHALTALLVLWALGERASERFAASALVASVMIDVDHVPALLGGRWLTAGTPRPYTHSLLTIAVVLLAARVSKRRSDTLLGVAIGLAIHFWRDMAEPNSGVALLWPLSDRSFSLPHGTYVAAVVVVITIVAARCRLRRGGSFQGVMLNVYRLRTDMWRAGRSRPRIHGRLRETVTQVVYRGGFSRRRADGEGTSQAQKRSIS